MYLTPISRISRIIDETLGLARPQAESLAGRIIKQCSENAADGASLDRVLAEAIGCPVETHSGAKLATYRITLLLEIIEGNFAALPDRHIAPAKAKTERGQGQP